MKVTSRGAESFLRGVDGKIAAILFYGPDAGLAHEWADRLTASVAGDASDPFRVSELNPARLREEPSCLADEAAALSFGGGRRVVRLRDAADSMSGAVELLLAGQPNAGLAILEGGDLGPRSSLRRLFESAANAVALPCYLDEAEALHRLIAEELGRSYLAIAGDALEYLAENLGGDRALTRRELEKLVCYMGDEERQIELADVLACVGDSAAQSLDDLVFAIGDGDGPAIERAMDRSFQEGESPVAILRAMARHILRLLAVAGADDRDAAMSRLRPPVFFKQVPRFKIQSRRWSVPLLGQALDRLARAELDCKRTGFPAETIGRRALHEVASAIRADAASGNPRR
ncbi:MAG: DNA polymerase III subunit delta [Dongiaceae bacterium]